MDERRRFPERPPLVGFPEQGVGGQHAVKNRIVPERGEVIVLEENCRQGVAQVFQVEEKGFPQPLQEGLGVADLGIEILLAQPLYLV